jgi:uncharacterized membrane protein
VLETIRLLYVGSGLLLTALSVPMILRRVPPNPLYGFRVPSTLRDPVLWYAANRYAGWRLALTGILTVIASIAFFRVPGLSLDNYAWACLAVVGLGLGLSLLQAFFFLRRFRKSRTTPSGVDRAVPPPRDPDAGN